MQGLADIAVIGLAGRFPGAGTVRDFWENLKNGTESITLFSDQELLAAGVEPGLLKDPGYVKAAPVLEGVDLFDAVFFGFNGREAALTDPQHRLFLECAWEALEDAGYDPERHSGPIGVYAGAGMPTYLFNVTSGRGFRVGGDTFELMIANDKDYLTTRVSYKLNLRGPSVAVQTACSSSLVAVHLACQGLLGYHCDMALAGGVSVLVPQRAGYLRTGDMVFSPDGHCRPFDARAQGTLFGSGVGIVVLKRLEDALADGDRIDAVIKGSAVNNDGSLKVSYTAPSVESQAEVIATALAVAGVEPETVTFVETHGTGTPLGDPIELEALSRVFPAGASGSCALGAVKANIGHLSAAAGIAGLIKTVLALKHGQLPPTPHFETPNPRIDFAAGPFHVPTELADWRPNGHPRRAGVSAFGIGGTNAHAVLEEAPRGAASGPSRPWQLLLLSAKTRTALEAATANLAELLARREDTALADVAFTLGGGRKVCEHRRALVCSSREDAVHALTAREPERVFSSFQEARDRPVAFLFPGQGSQHAGMAEELYRREPVFRQALDLACERLAPHLGLDLRQVLFPTAGEVEEATALLTRTVIAQPALFAVEQALAALWMAWGIRPAAMLGHSVGELVAACLAGVFSLEDALELVAVRGRLMQAAPPGAMASVALPEAELEPLLGDGLHLAAANAPGLCVVSGSLAAIEGLERSLRAEEREFRRLHTSHAFHSPMMDGAVAPFAEAVARVRRHPPQVPFLSNVTGTWITEDEAQDPQYWGRQLRRSVRFADGLNELLAIPGQALLEVGPGRTLCTLAHQHPAFTPDRLALPSLPPPRVETSEQAFLLTTLGRLWLAGVQPDWSGFHAGQRRHRIALPTYPFERRRYWLEPRFRGGHEWEQVEILGEGGEEAGGAAERPRRSLQTEYVAPRDERERRIAAIWQELLGIPDIGVFDNFFELGGHSLLATQMTARLRETFHTDISLAQLIERSTVASLAAFLAAAAPAPLAGSPAAAILPRIEADRTHRHEPFPLNEMQQALWVGRGGGFNISDVGAHLYLEVERQGLDLERLDRAWQRVIDRHEMLRTVILPEGRQKILAEVPPYQIPVLDLRGEEPARAEERLAAARAELAQKRHDLARWPVFEVRATLLDRERVRVHLSFDLLLTDLGSVRILLRDWHSFYDDPAITLPPLEISFRDYVLAETGLQASEAYQRSLAYWRERLPTLPPPPDLPLTQDPATVERTRYRSRTARLEGSAWRRLRARAARAGLSGSAVMLAAFSDVLGTWSKSPRFTVNLTVMNRLPFHSQVNEMVGCFASFAPIAVEDPALQPFGDLARRLQEQSWQDLEHRFVSGVRLLRELARQPGITPGSLLPVVFTSTLVHLEDGETDLPFAWLGDHVYNLSQTPQVWFGYSDFEDRDGLFFDWYMVEELFPPGMAEAMFDAFLGLLRRLADNEESWHQVPRSLTPPAHLVERAAANATALPVAESLLHTLSAVHAEERPEHPAVIAPGLTLTHGDLARRARQLGRRLRQLGARPNALIAVVMDKGWEQIVAVLGVLESGAAYLPVDGKVPRDRLWHLLQDGRVEVALTQPWLRDTLAWPPGLEVLTVDEEGLAGVEEGLLEPVATPADLAYVLYTSGSTGVPKGVMIAHRGAVNTVVDVNRRFAVHPGDRILALSSLGFDLSVYDVFGILAAGGTIILPEATAARDPAHWADLLVRERITLWSSVPALAEMLVEYAAGRELVLPLRCTLLSGDWIPLALPARLRTVAPGSEVVSLGGATEASIWSVLYPIGEVAPDWPSIPYGKPMANQRLHVLNQALEPCPEWVPGALYIAGTGLAEGYWGDEEKSRERFFPHPRTGERLYRTGDLGCYLPDGNVRFLGREDFQVKIRGHRIELGEIEAVLGQHPALRQVVVTARGEERSSGKRLTAYLVAGSEPAPRVEELCALAEEKLPEYMVPQDFVFLAELPLTPTGKVDRRRLPEPERADGAAADEEPPAPEAPVEELAAIFGEVLGRERIGLHDNFFQLGGDSIQGIQIISRAHQAGFEITPRQVFENPTIAQLARVVSRTSPRADQGPVTGPVPPTPWQRHFFERFPAGAGGHAQSVQLEAGRRIEPQLAGEVLRAILAHHDALRLRFEREACGWKACIAPPGDLTVPLAAFDLSGRSEAEQEAALEDAAARLRAELDLAAAPLLRVALFDPGEDRPGRLLLVAHELLMDEESWAILLRDLEPVPLPAKTTSFQRWAERLAEHGASSAVREELDYWLDPARALAPALPVDRAAEESTCAAEETVTVWLAADEARALFAEAPAAYNTGADEVLLAALAQAAAEWTGEPATLVELEGDGRRRICAGMDLSRTVGCFAYRYPMLLTVPGGGPGDRLKGIKEQLRSVPNGGIGHPLLLSGDDPEAAAALRRLPAPQIGFRYVEHGSGSESPASLFRVVGPAPRIHREPRAHRGPLVSVEAAREGSQLRVDLLYSRDLHRRETLERFGARLLDALRELIAHCRSPEAGGYTPSDFREAELSQEELDEFLSNLMQGEG